ncbi:PadR family transcriptional regulator [Staphylococcus shinii]|uniref:PadR family transcriptional regulator n=1 Tax=Staphylococcus shinii TaxID=2912228 RepID=UPI000C32439E|nr:PadR family transcriptional regulator [Staphylococcus shinii]PKI09563.1 PadR family transcriptional regulator [Staphylococcus shinii]PKI11458.1 PadR family transcriptional regulator [Staphylococcus shinii]
MNVQFKKGALELLVLLIINNNDQYGYSLIQIIAKKIAISEGTIYPLLRRLVKEGYLNSYYEPSREGPSRKYYAITVKGNERLKKLTEEWNMFTESINSFMKESDIHDKG